MFFLRKVLFGAGLLATTITAAPVEKRGGSIFYLSGDPVSIDPEGEYIRIARDNDNNLLAGYTAHEDGQAILRLAKSTNFGESWFFVGEVFRGDTNYHDIDNAFPLVMPNGDILFAYRNHDRHPTATDIPYDYFRISVSISTNGGQHFDYLSTVDERTPASSGASGIWEPFLRFDRNGNLQCYYSEENPAYGGADQDGWMRTSTDGGQTWSSNFIAVSGGDRTARDGMIGVAPVDNNGNLMAVFETNDNVPSGFAVDAVLSSDDGQTWGNRFRLHTAPNGKSAGAPQIYNVWGTLAVGFMSNEQHDNGNGYDGGDMMLMISNSGPHGFGSPSIVGPAPAHWEGIFNRDETHILAVYSGNNGAVSQLVELAD